MSRHEHKYDIFVSQISLKTMYAQAPYRYFSPGHLKKSSTGMIEDSLTPFDWFCFQQQRVKWISRRKLLGTCYVALSKHASVCKLLFIYTAAFLSNKHTSLMLPHHVTADSAQCTASFNDLIKMSTTDQKIRLKGKDVYEKTYYVNKRRFALQPNEHFQFRNYGSHITDKKALMTILQTILYTTMWHKTVEL